MTSILSRSNKEVDLYDSATQEQLQHDLTDYCSFLFTFNQELDQDDYTSFLQTYSTRMQTQRSNQDNLFCYSDMSNSNSNSQSYSSSTYTSIQSGGAPQTWRSTESFTRNPQGTTIHRTSEQPGQDPSEEKIQLDSQGRQVLAQPQESRKIEDVSEADKEYSVRMEDEYVKREGGA